VVNLSTLTYEQGINELLDVREEESDRDRTSNSSEDDDGVIGKQIPRRKKILRWMMMGTTQANRHKSVPYNYFSLNVWEICHAFKPRSCICITVSISILTNFYIQIYNF
jgi:hypothetical protein